VTQHDPADRLFLFWAPHIVHAPLEVPSDFFLKFRMVQDDKPSQSRQKYHAMVNFADEAIGNLTSLLKSKGMWDETVVVFSSDNGGPIYAAGSAGANNYPLKGGKMNNWEGGIRVNAWVSGGFVAPSMRGTKYEGLVTGWDWYATFCALAGVDPTDHRAALANLPPIDSHSHAGLILGTSVTSPRTEIPVGSDPVPSNLTNAKPCASYSAKGYGPAGVRRDDPLIDPELYPDITGPGVCASVNGVIVDERGTGSGIWKLLLGDVAQDMYEGPHFPNASTIVPSSAYVGHCANGCLYNILADPLEANDLAASMPTKVAELYAKITAYQGTAFDPDRGKTDPAACAAAADKYGGFWGPFVFP